jgi:hypothetical protein
MPEMTTQKCRACIDTGTLGPEGECTDPAHQTTPDIAPPQATPPRTTVLSPDWTALGTRSNSSPMFLALRAEVESIIRESAHALIAGRAGGVAGTILATLAHRHGLRPGDAVTTEPDVDRARRALRAFIEHLDAAPSATVLDALNSALLAYDPPPADLREAIDSIRLDLGHTRETIGPVVVEHSPRGSYVVGSTEPPTDLRDAIARAAGLAIAQCHDDGPLTWHPCGQCQGTPCACSGEPFSVVVADAVLPVVARHVAAEVERARGAAGRALTLVAGTSCEKSTAGPGTCWRDYRDPNAKYGAERWCDPCIALAALTPDATDKLWQEHPGIDQCDQVAAGGEQRG